MKRFINGIIALLLAGAVTIGSAYAYDLWQMYRRQDEIDITEVTSSLTPRIYALDNGNDTETVFGILEDTADKYAAKKVASSGGGKYTDTSGNTHYVPPFSGGGGYSGSSSYYDDDGWDGGGYSEGTSGGGGSSGGTYDDGPGTLYDVEVDDTEYNYCQDCGTHYIGTGGCPNPDCESYNP